MMGVEHESDHRPMRYVELDPATNLPVRIVYRASSLGGCPRAFVAMARGVTPEPWPDKFEAILAEGDLAEPQILAMFEEMGAPPTVMQQHRLELHLFKHDLVVDGAVYEVDVIVRGHIDGASIEDGKTVIREAKKFRPSTFPNFQRKGCEVLPMYPWQVSAVMHSVKQTEDYYPLVEMLGGLWAVDGADGVEKVMDLSVHYLDNPPIPLKAIKVKVLQIEELLEQGFDPIEVECREDQYPCPFYKLHPSRLNGEKDGKTLDVVKVRDIPEDIQVLLQNDTMWTARIAGLDKDRRKIDESRKAGRVRLQAWLDEQGIKPGVQVEAGHATLAYEAWEKKGYEVKPSSGVKLTVKSKHAHDQQEEVDA